MIYFPKKTVNLPPNSLFNIKIKQFKNEKECINVGIGARHDSRTDFVWRRYAPSGANVI